MAERPTVSTEWAIGASALKFNPTTQQRTWGWTTSNNLTTGVPEKPTLQHQNGWQYNVHLWLTYFATKTDEMQPPLSPATAGLFLGNDGFSTSWQSPFPLQTGNSGKFLQTNGTSVLWADPFPDQTGNSGKFLSTNGTSTLWSAVPLALGDGTPGLYRPGNAAGISSGTIIPVPVGSIGEKVDWAGVNTTSSITGGTQARIGDATSRITLNKGIYLIFLGGSATVSDNTTRMLIILVPTAGAATITYLSSRDLLAQYDDLAAFGAFGGYNVTAYLVVTQDSTVIEAQGNVIGGNVTNARVVGGAAIRQA